MLQNYNVIHNKIAVTRKIFCKKFFANNVSDRELTKMMITIQDAFQLKNACSLNGAKNCEAVHPPIHPFFHQAVHLLMNYKT